MKLETMFGIQFLVYTALSLIGLLIIGDNLTIKDQTLSLMLFMLGMTCLILSFTTAEEQTFGGK